MTDIRCARGASARRPRRLVLLAGALILAGGAAPVAALPQEPLALVPLPNAVSPIAGSGFTMEAQTPVVAIAGDRGAATAARLFVERVRSVRGLTLNVASPGAMPARAIRFVRDASVAGREGYRLTVRPDGIEVAASGDAGLVWGAMTLAQLASPDGRVGRAVTIPALVIGDAPRFSWRGLMVDPSRHFQPIEELYRIVDQMAAVKLNTLHLHLSDDQGWRFEVKRYPKLTQLGAWRLPPSPGGPVGAKVGGFYTQDQLRALVAYAGDRGITIVPEIDLPGHAQALVAAYPEFGVLGDRPPVSHDWGVNPYLLDPGPKGVAFVEAVLDELMAVFPGTYIHLGGDEAIKDQWQRSPAVQARIKALGVKDENGLQSWLIDTFGKYLAAKGRRLIGWDEILEGGLPPSASVMSWRGEKGAVEAANAGHDVVLSPAPTLYLDSLQSDHGDEPPGRLSIQTLADVYRYEPMPAGIAPDKAGHVLGAQGNGWSEYLISAHQVEHALFPRAGAIAEIGWTAKDMRDFAGFLPRLDAQARRWRRGGIEVADSAFAVDYSLSGTRGEALRTGRMTVALATQAPYGTIRYTTNGAAPSAASPAYVQPLTLRPGATIRAAAFRADGTPAAEPRAFDTTRAALLTRTSAQMVACPRGSLGLRVPLTADATADAPAYNVNLFDTCTAYPAVLTDIATGFTVDVARLSRNYGLAHDFTAVRRHYNVTPFGELTVLVGCTDKDAKPVVAATFALPDPATTPQRFAFTGTLPQGTGDRDVCFQFTAPVSDPFYTVERVALSEARR